jgi:TfoX/Sxy family transcriptional regulator of competence genes
MPYSEELAARARAIITDRVEALGDPSRALKEKKMFGSLAFMVGGHMACGVLDDRMMMRVGPDSYEAALAEPDATVMEFTGRPMKGFVYARPADDERLGEWVDRALTYVTSMRPK